MQHFISSMRKGLPKEMSDQDLFSRSIYRLWTKDIVRYSDLDPNGHVNNGAVNQYFEDGRIALRTDYMAGLEDDLLGGFAIKKFTATYHGALSYPATIDVGTLVVSIGNSSFVLAQSVFDRERCIATAEVTSVYFDPKKQASKPLPKLVCEAQEKALITF